MNILIGLAVLALILVILFGRKSAPCKCGMSISPGEATSGRAPPATTSGVR